MSNCVPGAFGEIQKRMLTEYHANDYGRQVWQQPASLLSSSPLRTLVHHSKRAAVPDLAPHDLRRTCARLCHLAGGELEQIQFLLGHASVQTTERYLGCKQKLSQAVNDNLGLEDP